MKCFRSVSLVFMVFFGLPVFLHAQIIFTEIMFNVQGSDYHDEYVELYNLSETELWVFFRSFFRTLCGSRDSVRIISILLISSESE